MTLAPTVCPTCGTENGPGVKFCAECGTKLAPATPSREVRKLVTVLFTDVTGSTALGEQLDPETLRAVMARYFAMIKRVIERHGGTVEKFIGDAVMAVFGIPVVHEDDALRAVRAAAEIQAELVGLNSELEASRGIAIRFRTGVNTGEVVAGDPTADATIVTGDTVNTAARLEQHAPPGEILLGGLTYRLVRDAVEVEPVEPIAAKGKAEPVAAFRLVGVKAGAAGHARRLDAPLVGRARELARLEQAFRSAVEERSCQLFTLLGTAGVGKSRLVAEFTASVGPTARVLRGRCLSYGEGITYWPVGEIVRGAAGIDEADTAEAARAKLRSLLEGEREADLLATRVAAAIGLSAEPAPQEELFWAIRKLLEHLAAEQPLVVVIEDIHWAEPTLLDLIEHIADWSRDAPLLVLCPARPELLDVRPAWGGGKLNATTVLLEPLGAEATGELIAALPGGTALPDAAVARIEAAAEGNPLYVEELLAMLVDEGRLTQRGDGTWQAAPDITSVSIPPTITALLAARLERLGPAERAVAERASVVGRVFEQAAVSELADAALRPEVAASLRALVKKELVRPDRSELSAGEAFKFRHILIRDAAYEALPKAERASLHERFADWLERTAGDRLAELTEIVGYHLAEAHRYRTELGESGERVERLAERAAEQLGAAGERAYERGDVRAAVRLLSAAIALRSEGDAEGDFLRLRLIPAFAEAGRPAEARRLASEIASRSHQLGNVLLEARAVVLDLELEAEFESGASVTFAERLRNARALVDQSSDPLALMVYWRTVSSSEWNDDRFEPSVAALDLALSYAVRLNDKRALEAMRVMKAIEKISGPGDVAGARAEVDALLATPGLTIPTRAEVLQRRGILSVTAGSPAEDGRVDVAEALRLLEELGQVGLIPENRRSAAWVERLVGDYGREIAFLDLCLAQVRPIGNTISWFQAMVEAQRALALAKQGRLVEARQGVEHAAGIPGAWVERLSQQAKARMFAAAGDVEKAAKEAQQIEAAAEKIPFPLARADAFIESAVVARLTGDDVSAERRASKAFEVASRKGSVAHQRKARAVLAGDLSRL